MDTTRCPFSSSRYPVPPLILPTSGAAHALHPVSPLPPSQVFIVLVVTRILGRVLKFVQQPAVIGEIIGGIILGPSVLGRANGWTAAIFPKESLGQFVLVAQIGLIFFMFFLGMELDPNLMKRQAKVAAPIAVSAVLFPFGVGAALSVWMYNRYATHDVNMLSFILFFGAAMSFTAFPVLAAILKENKLLSDPMGVLAFSCAAIDDITAWCVLAFATSFSVSSAPEFGVYTSLIAAGYVAIMLLVIKPLMRWAYDRLKQRHAAQERRGKEVRQLSRTYVTLVLLLVVASSFFTEVIGIHAFFGAFVAGLCVPKDGTSFVHLLAPKIELIVTDFLMPLYFANSGLKLNLGAISGKDVGPLFAIIVVACLGKFLPTCLVARWTSKNSWRYCVSLGILMNTRGLVQLIVLNVGKDIGVLSTELFTLMVIMAIVTTVITPPAFYHIYVKHLPPKSPTKTVDEEAGLSPNEHAVTHSGSFNNVISVHHEVRPADSSFVTLEGIGEVLEFSSSIREAHKALRRLHTAGQPIPQGLRDTRALPPSALPVEAFPPAGSGASATATAAGFTIKQPPTDYGDEVEYPIADTHDYGDEEPPSLDNVSSNSTLSINRSLPDVAVTVEGQPVSL